MAQEMVATLRSDDLEADLDQDHYQFFPREARESGHQEETAIL